MAKPDYVPEEDEARWGITTLSGQGTIADYIPGTNVDRVADGLMSADMLPKGTPHPEPRHGPRDVEADERSRTGAAKVVLPGGPEGPPLVSGDAVALTQPPAKNRGGKGKKADATPKPEPDPVALLPKTLEEALAFGLTEETGGTPGGHVQADDARVDGDASAEAELNDENEA